MATISESNRFFVITGLNNRIVYIPVSRLLRIETSPAEEPGAVPTVKILFEGNFSAIIQFKPGTAPRFLASYLYDLLIEPEKQEDVFLRPGDRYQIDEILFDTAKPE